MVLGRVVPVVCVLQLLPDSQITSGHARNGSRDHGSRLGAFGTAGLASQSFFGAVSVRFRFFSSRSMVLSMSRISFRTILRHASGLADSTALDIGPKTVEFHIECVRFLAAKGLLNRTLVSQDAGWYHVGEPGGGEFRGYR